MSDIDYERLQQEAKCNWCRNPLSMSESITEKNLVDTGKKWPAVYCNDCLAIEFRVKQPKTAINPQTLDEVNLEDLPSESTTAEEQEQKQEEEEEEEE